MLKLEEEYDKNKLKVLNRFNILIKKELEARMTTKEEEEENEYIKGVMVEGLIPIYQHPSTSSELKQKILEELFDRLVRLESFEQTITNRRLYYEKWLSERGYFGEWDNIEKLATNKDNAYVFGVASGIYDVCTTLLKIATYEKSKTKKEKIKNAKM